MLERSGFKIKSEGFTLVEILVVIAMIGLIFSLTIPVSYELYKSYKNSLKAQEVMLYLSSLKRESFLYSQEKEISSSDGLLIVNGEKQSFQGIYITVKKPFKFFKNGTSDGGEIEMKLDKEKYIITVEKPFGELSLERVKIEKT